MDVNEALKGMLMKHSRHLKGMSMKLSSRRRVRGCNAEFCTGSGRIGEGDLI